jgi:hypothetical protein
LCICGFIGALDNLLSAAVVSGVAVVFLAVKKQSDALYSILLAVGIAIADGTRSAQKTIERKDEDYRSHPKAAIITDYVTASAFGSAIGFLLYLTSKERRAKRKDDN